MLILCTVYFLLPFALRGARLAVSGIKNNVADWLPADYPETKDLEEFRKNFIGDTFIVVSGPWCKADDPTFTNLERKIYEESLDYERVLLEANKKEEVRAHRKGDELGLMFTGTYHEDWGLERERWLLGRNEQWYFINRKGELFEWKGQNNIVEGFNRFLEKTVNGKNKAIGKNIGKFGNPPNDVEGIENEFYADPQKLCARPFKSVTTGPSALLQMAGENGTIKIGTSGKDSKSSLDAQIEAHRRLTGALFGKTPQDTFGWTYTSLLQHVDDENVLNMLQKSEEMRKRFDAFIDFTVQENFEGDFAKLQSSGLDEQIAVWYEMWDALKIPPPARQTCLVVTLNEPVIEELKRAVGRPLFGKPRGRILELATGECGISPENLHIGGPPCDNVAIDEEGTNTLLRLVSLSAIIGISLAYFSFRSIRVTCMLFFVAGVAAISSLSYVWFAGSSLDAILLSMPSLVYVLALSAAVHLVNYYRDACHETGPETAVEKAFAHAFFPCSLAAFTTALGLISLYASNLVPIKKFGLFSAIAVLATVVLLFTYLPSALSVWPPGYKKLTPKERKKGGTAAEAIGRVWSRIGEWVIQHHAIVTITSMLLMGVAAYGITRVETSVHLLKLFDNSAKILADYRWMEGNLGKLVPMELMVRVDSDRQKEFNEPKTTVTSAPVVAATDAAESGEGSEAGAPEAPKEPELTEAEKVDLAQKAVQKTLDENLKFSMLERVELSQRIRIQLERVFGPESLDIVGRGMSTDVFLPMQQVTSAYQGPGILDTRRNFSNSLSTKRNQMVEQDYLAIDPNDESELWRISIRLAALNDVDYGEFIDDIKTVVEPIMLAYDKRTELLQAIQSQMGEASIKQGNILVIGMDPNPSDKEPVIPADKIRGEGKIDVDQTFLFADTLHALLENRGYKRVDKPKKNIKQLVWLNPADFAANPAEDSGLRPIPEKESLVNLLKIFDCVVIVNDEDKFYGEDFIRQNSKLVVDARDHDYLLGKDNKSLTSRERKQNGEDVGITTVYTGIIPIVYKSQRALLHSLIESIGLAFVMIAIVMMILLRNWNRPFSPKNALNVTGGMISMIPNVFPVVLIFGAMGLLMVKVDIGTMMTASVAMGVAVDDTIHYLNWYRQGLNMGLTRKSAIRMAYDRVATAMTQTTLIGGFGLSAFAFSTFTPTQRFGVMMLILLVAALIGDLILLPAILAGPLGKFFGKEKENAVDQLPAADDELDEDESPELRVVEADDENSDLKTDIHPDSFKHLPPTDEKNVADG